MATCRNSAKNKKSNLNLIIFQHVTYREAVGLASLETLFDRRQAQTVKMFQDFSNNPDHKLYRFLAEPNKCIFNLRNS